MTGESSHDDQPLIATHLTVSNTTDLDLQTTFRSLAAALSIKENEVPGYSTKLCSSVHFFYSGILCSSFFQKLQGIVIAILQQGPSHHNRGKGL